MDEEEYCRRINEGERLCLPLKESSDVDVTQNLDESDWFNDPDTSVDTRRQFSRIVGNCWRVPWRRPASGSSVETLNATYRPTLDQVICDLVAVAMSMIGTSTIPRGGEAVN